MSSHFHLQTKTGACSFCYTPLFWRGEEDLFLWRRRAGEQQVSAVRFAYFTPHFIRFIANCSLSLAPPLFKSSSFSTLITKTGACSFCYTPLFWRGEEDLNLRRLLTSHDFQSCALNRSAISASLLGILQPSLKYHIKFEQKNQAFL